MQNLQKTLLPRLLLGLMCLTLAGCALPRGAAFQNEVLSVAEDDDLETPDFLVEPVTRAALTRYEAWPTVGERHLHWLSRQAQPANQIIAAGDKVSVTVWNTEENSLLTAGGQRFVELQSVTVSSAGEIFLPYLGEFKISGMSPGHARSVIEERFAEVIPSAQVQLSMEQGRLNTVNVIGGVGAPGSYPLVDRNVSLLTLVSESGGISTSLANPQVRLLRGDSVYGISASRLMANPSNDVTLQGGDKIYVEEDARYFLSLGAAGSESLHPFTKDTVTALDAMSIIGGISDTRADPGGILILREYPTSAVRVDGAGPSQTRVVFTLDLTTADGLFSARRFEINSGDLVYVTESPINSARTIFGLIGTAFSLTNQLSQ